MAKREVSRYAGTREGCPACWQTVFIKHTDRWSKHTATVNGQRATCINSGRLIGESYTGR
jgi:hypothetical protein